MPPIRQSEIFKFNILLMTIIGFWPQKKSSLFYKCYFAVITSFSFVSWILFTLNFFYAPVNLAVIINQCVFYFSEIAARIKIFMVIVKQRDIIQLFDILDSKIFISEDETVNRIIKSNQIFYRKYRIACILFYCTGIMIYLIPVIEYWIISNRDLELPQCQYYFLSDEIREKYFTFLFMYQYVSILLVVLSNASVDPFICGLIMTATTQYKVLNWKISHLIMQTTKDLVDNEMQLKDQLNECLKYYDVILKYCHKIQDIMSISLFAQYATGAVTICISLSSFLIPMSREDFVFMICYTFAMTLEIFYPAFLGAELTRESEHLMFSAYCSDWMSRPENFKRSLRLMVERAKKPAVITGLKMFRLSLATFTSIIKTSYSFFTLLKCFLERE